MPDHCCAIDCSNTRGKCDNTISFYSFPTKLTEKSTQRRKKWIAALKRKNWPKSEKQVDNARLCSAHFVTGQKSNDELHVDYIPTVFSFVRNSDISRKRKSLDRYERTLKRAKTSSSLSSETCVTQQEDNLEEETSPKQMSKGTQASNIALLIHKYKMRYLHQQLLKKQNIIKKLKQKYFKIKQKVVAKKFSYESIKEKDLPFLTGIANSQLFNWLLCMLKPTVTLVVNHFGFENHLLLVLMKLKLGLLNRDISIRFDITESKVSKIYRSWITPLANLLKNFIVWPDKESLRKHLPSCFSAFKNCICIIDCTEVFIERPLNQLARAQTYSNYKSHNTAKYLIGITPAGAVSFLSRGWGGRASDKLITIKSGFLDFVVYGDCVLADRGFLIEEELATRGAVLRLPSFTKGRKQMTARDVDISRQIAHVWIHVERVIGRIKKFRILGTIIPISQVDLIDDIMIIICGLINLSPSVVNKNAK